jgi:translation initiation factor 1
MNNTKLNSLAALAALINDVPQVADEAEEPVAQSSIRLPKQILKIGVDKKLKGGKVATYIVGWQGDHDAIEALAKELKALCGAGGSYKNNEVLVQGNHLEKIKNWLVSQGHQVK